MKMNNACFILFVFASMQLTAQQRIAVLGRVVDCASGQPIEGAHVRHQWSLESAYTDSMGYFTLRVDTTLQGYYSFDVSAAGFVFSDLGERPLKSILITDTLHPVLCMTETPVSIHQSVVITARRSRERNLFTPHLLTTFNAENWRYNQARSVPEALMNMPGIWVQKTNHGGGSVFLRGLTGQQNLLLIDGIRMNTGTYRSGPNQYLNTVDPAMIGRVEVLHGAGSVAYGSDAIGGVVNLLTEDTQRPDGRLHGRYTVGGASHGMEHTHATQLAWSHPKEKVQSQAMLSWRDFGDLQAGKGIGRQSPNGYQQRAAQAKLRFQLPKVGDLTLFWHQLRQDSVPLYHRIALENFSRWQFDRQSRSLSYLRWQSGQPWRIGKHLRVEPLLVAGWQQNEEQRSFQKNNSTLRTHEADEVRTLFWIAQFNTWRRVGEQGHWAATHGAESYYDVVNSARTRQNGSGAPEILRGLYPNDARMNQTALFSMHRLGWRHWQISGGVRWSLIQLRLKEKNLGEIQLTPNAWVGNLSLAYHWHKRLFLYTQLSTAFRAPNIDDLGTLGIVDFRYELPNNQLRPETARSAEVGLKYESKTFLLGFSAYHTQLLGAIGRIKTNDSIQGYAVYLKKNIGESYIYGGHAHAAWHLHRNWRLDAHFTYTYGQNITDSEPFRRIPPAFGCIQLGWQAHPHFHVQASCNIAGAQRRLAQADVDDNRIGNDGTPGWTTANLRVRYERKWLMLILEGQNVGNTAYRIHGSGVDGIGRSLWVRMQLSF